MSPAVEPPSGTWARPRMPLGRPVTGSGNSALLVGVRHGVSEVGCDMRVVGVGHGVSEGRPGPGMVRFRGLTRLQECPAPSLGGVAIASRPLVCGPYTPQTVLEAFRGLPKRGSAQPEEPRAWSVGAPHGPRNPLGDPQGRGSGRRPNAATKSLPLALHKHIHIISFILLLFIFSGILDSSCVVTRERIWSAFFGGALAPTPAFTAPSRKPCVYGPPVRLLDLRRQPCRCSAWSSSPRSAPLRLAILTPTFYKINRCPYYRTGYT